MKPIYLVAIIGRHGIQYLTPAGRLSTDTRRARTFKTRSEALKVAHRVYHGQVVRRFS